MSDEPVEVLPLDYAQDESLSWRTVAKAVATLILIFSGARLLAAVIHMATYTVAQGIGLITFWAYSVSSLADAVPLLGIVIASVYYSTSGRGRIGIVCALAAYMLLRIGMAILMLVAAVSAYQGGKGPTSSGYVLAIQLNNVASVLADCIWPAAAIWFFTRPALRRFS